MTIDIAAVREQFPSLRSGIAHFDGPGGTQAPTVVGEAIARTLTGPLSNRGTGIASEDNAEHAIREFRSAMADLLGGVPEGVVYGRSATQIAYDFSRHLAKDWAAGDEIVVTELDHDSNVRPWIQAAEARGVTVRWLRLDPATADLDLSTLGDVVGARTRLVAVGAASNLLGTKPAVARIAARAHEVGALVYVDAVHYAAHGGVDLAALGADFLVCSPYKFFGPHCAALIADPALLETITPDKLAPSTDVVPERFEFGTLPYEIMAGATAAVDFIAGFGSSSGARRERLIEAHHAIDTHEMALRRRIEEGLAGLGDRVIVHSTAADRTPTTFFTLTGADAAGVSRALRERDILIPAGTFYAHELARALGLGDRIGLRLGLAPYNEAAEVDRALEALDALV